MKEQEIKYTITTLDLSEPDKVKKITEAFKQADKKHHNTLLCGVIAMVIGIVLLCVQWQKIYQLESQVEVCHKPPYDMGLQKTSKLLCDSTWDYCKSHPE